MLEQRGIAEAAFDAVDRTIDSTTAIAIFSHYKPNPYRETTKEQWHTDHNFIQSLAKLASSSKRHFKVLTLASETGILERYAVLCLAQYPALI
jgi:hypothetical protein